MACSMYRYPIRRNLICTTCRLSWGISGLSVVCARGRGVSCAHPSSSPPNALRSFRSINPILRRIRHLKIFLLPLARLRGHPARSLKSINRIHTPITTPIIQKIKPLDSPFVLGSRTCRLGCLNLSLFPDKGYGMRICGDLVEGKGRSLLSEEVVA